MWKYRHVRLSIRGSRQSRREERDEKEKRVVLE
jgi:hypothetical protein